MTVNEALINYSLRLGDSALILGQRMAEWCSNGPILEEDIALSNIGLDLFGQSRTMLSYAGELEGKGRTEDDLAFKRTEREYYNVLLSELPNGHFGDTVARNFLHSAFFYHLYKALTTSKNDMIAAHAAKSIKEITYHLRHSAEWMVRLGDGTQESHEKIQQSLELVWPFTGDLFEMNEVDALLIKEAVAVDLNTIKPLWDATINEVLERATLQRPEDGYMHSGRLNALHTEYLGHMLGDMQYMQRTYPNCEW
jgi:ring-1,2-phenylacetyl-CoA epoxidase subunit PaaC